MQFHQLRRVHKNKRSVQVGRGGKRGKTSGRGGKGQTARAGHKIYPQMRDALRRIPKLRGRGKSPFKSFEERSTPVNLEIIETTFETGSVIHPEALVSHGIVETRSGRVPRIKILGRGTLTKKVTVTGCSVSKSAKEAIERVGGSVEIKTNDANK